MTAKQTTDIAEALEKLGYEIISLVEKKERPDFPRIPMLVKIVLTPISPSPKLEIDSDKEGLL